MSLFYCSRRVLNNYSLIHQVKRFFNVISKTDVQQFIDSERGDYILIDVRKPEEYSHGVIPTAKTLPLGELPEALAMKEKDWEAKYNFKKIQPNDTIILYCRSGKRSDTASQILEARGFKHILNYEGSYI